MFNTFGKKSNCHFLVRIDKVRLYEKAGIFLQTSQDNQIPSDRTEILNLEQFENVELVNYDIPQRQILGKIFINLIY